MQSHQLGIPVRCPLIGDRCPADAAADAANDDETGNYATEETCPSRKVAHAATVVKV